MEIYAEPADSTLTVPFGRQFRAELSVAAKVVQRIRFWHNACINRLFPREEAASSRHSISDSFQTTKIH